MPPSDRPFTVNGVLPELHDPVMVVNLTGWIDASGAGAAAVEHIARLSDTVELITFDGDAFIDYRARRPVMEIRQGVNAGVRWSLPTIRLAQDAKGRDLLLLSGPEPDFAWQRFCSAVADIAVELGVKQMIGLGAYPYGSPHTRRVRLTHTTPDPAISARMNHDRNTLDVPAGVSSCLELEMHSRGIASLTLWAQVPHYVATMQFSAASAALIEAVRVETGLAIDSSLLDEEAVVQRERLDNLVGANPEHAEMITKLEQAYDAAHSPAALEIVTDLPSAEQLAEEVEKFLREQQSGEQQ